MATILIKNAQIIDGTGSPPYKGDVLVKDETISAIGSLGKLHADQVVNAAGMYCTPGFIDVDTDSDHYLALFTNPEQQDFLRQGVTTIFGGFCGASLAPLMYGELKSVRKWADVGKVNVNWATLQEFLDVLEARKLGVNFGTFVGHGTIRRELIGEARRDLTVNELEVFEKILIAAMEEGAYGMSTGLGYIHEHETPYYELKRLLDVVHEYKGIYATHLRDETEHLVQSVEETVRIAEETKVPVLISHMRPLKGYEPEYTEALRHVSRNANVADISFDLYPFDESHLALYKILPGWAQRGNLEEMLADLEGTTYRDRIKKEMQRKLSGTIRIASAPKSEFLVGKTLGEIAKNRNTTLVDALFAVIKMTGMRATIFYQNIDYPLVLQALTHERSLIGSNFLSLPPGGLKTERGTETFPKFLDLAANKKLMPIELAIKKITARPAELFGLPKRGILKEGNHADITLFQAGQGNAVVRHVIVNGLVAVRDATLTNGSAGRILRHRR